MAIMIPQQLADSSDVANEFYQNLHLQLGPEYKISQYLDSAFTLQGTLLWLQYRSQSLFIYVSDLSDEALNIDKTKDISKKVLQKQALETPEIKKIAKYKQFLLPEKLRPFHSQLTPFIIIYSQISETKLNVQFKSLGLSLLGKELLQSENLKSILTKFSGSPYSKNTQRFIQKSFNPETQVIHDSNEHLLDKEQEAAIKVDIGLDKEKVVPQNYNLSGVNGGSSSGKSEIVLLRAKLLNKLNPELKILVLSANNASQENLNKRLSKTNTSFNAKNITLLSFNKWCQSQLSPDKKMIDESTLKKCISNIVREHLSEKNISLLVFLRELNYIQGKAITDEISYLKIRKASQLSNEQHKDIWHARQVLDKSLLKQNALLYSDLPKLLWEANQHGKAIDRYDHILIDDAHYFSPLAFELVKKALEPNTGQLFISQDPQQGIVNPISLWKDTGLDLRGKSIRLLNCYQTNPYILNAANAFYMSRLPDDTDKVIQFNFTNDKNYKKPDLLHFHNIRDQENRLLNEIRTLIRDDIKLENILVISYDQRSCQHLAELIQQTINVTATIVDSTSKLQNSGISLCTLEQSQGLRFPYVFIFGLEALFENDQEFAKETSSINTDNYHQAIYIENTRKLNMAMTSASTHLTLFLSADSIPSSLVSPHIKTPTIDSHSLAEVHQLRSNASN